MGASRFEIVGPWARVVPIKSLLMSRNLAVLGLAGYSQGLAFITLEFSLRGALKLRGGHTIEGLCSYKSWIFQALENLAIRSSNGKF